MKLIVVVLAVVATCNAATAGLRVRFGISLLDEYFIHIPRVVSDAVDQGWTATERPEGPRASLTMYCPSDRVLCALYDDTLNIAGLQIALPVDQFSDAVFDWTTQGFTQWNPPALEGEAVNTYWTNQQYFVSEEYLAKSVEERLASWDESKVLQEDAVWVTGFYGELERISTNATDIENSEFTKQACIPLMGRHHYWKMTEEIECAADTMFPWFSLTNSGQLVATGFTIFGKMNTTTGNQDWFEYPTQLISKLIVPNGPDCLYELAGEPGLISLHVYYVERPLLLNCINE